jgi:3-methyladenine DNA glycosylase/8-oxoguanine DNA glycosylase
MRAVNKRALAHLRTDPAMAGLIDRVGPVKLRPRRLPPFQSLTHAVIHQQLHAQAAGTILGRFRALFGDDGFPTPEAVLKASPERLSCVHMLPLESAVPPESGIFSVPLCLGMALCIACKAASRSSSLVACR